MLCATLKRPYLLATRRLSSLGAMAPSTKWSMAWWGVMWLSVSCLWGQGTPGPER